MGHGDSCFVGGVDIVLPFMVFFFILRKLKTKPLHSVVFTAPVTVAIAEVTELAGCDAEVSHVHLVNLTPKAFSC